MPHWQEFAPSAPPPFFKYNRKPLEDFYTGNVMVCRTFLKDDSD